MALSVAVPSAARRGDSARLCGDAERATLEARLEAVLREAEERACKQDRPWGPSLTFPSAPGRRSEISITWTKGPRAQPLTSALPPRLEPAVAGLEACRVRRQVGRAAEEPEHPLLGTRPPSVPLTKTKVWRRPRRTPSRVREIAIPISKPTRSRMTTKKMISRGARPAADRSVQSRYARPCALGPCRSRSASQL
jgi:hypothetical protein